MKAIMKTHFAYDLSSSEMSTSRSSWSASCAIALYNLHAIKAYKHEFQFNHLISALGLFNKVGNSSQPWLQISTIINMMKN